MQDEVQNAGQAPKSAPPKLAFRPAEAAQAVGLSESYIRAELQRGHIKAKKSGANTLILTTALLDWLDSLPDWRPTRPTE